MKNQSVEMFSPDHDTDLRFHEISDLNYASQWTSIPVHVQEALNLYRELPIVFHRNATGTFEIIALLTQNGDHLIKTGQWSTKQQPDLLTLYPFTWLLKQRDIKLAYYSQAPHFQGEGQKLITSKGKPTRKLNQVIRDLDKAQRAFSITGQRMMELIRFDLLTPITLAQNVTLPQETYWVLREALSDEIRSQLSPEVLQLLDCHVKSLTLLPAVNGSLAPAELKSPVPESKTNSANDSPKKAEAKPKPAKGKEKSNQDATIQNKTSKNKTSKNKTTQDTGSQAQNNSAAINALVKQACDQFEVSLEEIQSRKRNDALTKARHYLAVEATANNQLNEMAKCLERSPATLNSWLK